MHCDRATLAIQASSFLAALAIALLPSAAHAQPSFFEIEPNNTPAEANAIEGEITVLGELGGTDQDAYLWTVSDVGAQKRWTFELEGVPGAPTVTDAYRLEFAENGVDVSSKTQLFQIGSRDGSKPGRIEDLIFEPGDYLLGVASAGSVEGGYRLHIRQGEKLVLASRPAENPTRERAQRLRSDAEYANFISTTSSWFQFELKEKDTEQLWAVSAQLPLGQKAQVKVYDNEGELLTQNSLGKVSRRTSKALELDAGTYFVEITGDAAGSIRAIRAHPIGARFDSTGDSSSQVGNTTSPRHRSASQGSWRTAPRVDLTAPISGRFSDAKELHYRAFELDDASADQVLTLAIETTSDRKITLCLLNAKGDRVQCRDSNQGSVALPDLVLPFGTWGLLAEAKGGEPTDYTLSLTRTGPIQPGIEAEPNDKVAQATTIPANNRVKGRFAGKETDFYRIVVTGDAQLWRFQAVGDEIISLSYHDGAGLQNQKMGPDSGQRRVRLENVYLLPGQHFVSIRGDKGGQYTLLARPLGPPDPDGEREPNGEASRAEVLLLGQERHGTLENTDDQDFYRFYLANDEHLRLTITPPADGQIHPRIDYGETQFASQRKAVGEAAVLQGMFAPGEYQVRLSAVKPSEARYSIELERLPRFGCSVDCEPVHTRRPDLSDHDNPASNARALPVEMQLTPQAETVAAYLRLGQRVPAQLRLTNQGSAPLDLEVETATSDYRWPPPAVATTLQLAAGESDIIDLDIRVPPDAWGDQPVVISVRAVDGSGAQAETTCAISVDGSAEPVEPELAWPLPDNMVGGLNVAWSALGAQVVGDAEDGKPGTIPGLGRYLDELFDGKVRPSAGPILDPDREDDGISITVDLAGEEPQRIVGIVLNPVGRQRPVQYLDEFELQLSLDGSTFDTVLRDRLKQLPLDQAFALDEPAEARFARLLMLSSHDGTLRQGAGIGEWKVVAEAGTDGSSGKGWNLARPRLGGHVVWSKPWISGAGAWEGDLLAEQQGNPVLRLQAGQFLQWAVSFQHQRAARIARFEWSDSDRAKPEERLQQISVAVSLDSPVGPWTKIADWELSSSPVSLELEEPVWARYVRFRSEARETKSRVYAPDALRIYEEPSSSDYASSLGEWGESSWMAQYELSHGLDSGAAAFVTSGNNSRATAASLDIDKRVGGRVLLGQEEDWYKLDVPAGKNTLNITLGGMPSVRTVVTLTDASGSEVRLKNLGSRPNASRFKAIVEPGTNYFIEVKEPPRAVVFAFDNSGSVSAFKEAIYRAVNSYAGDLVPGRDVANVFPFGGGLLMSDWVGEPYILRLVLNDYDRSDDSSAAEKSLALASRALDKRPGTKAVVLVTDAATPRFPRLWDSLDKVQPRVFTMRVGNADKTGLYEDLMQSWARVNDGHYDYLTSQGGMDRAFDRAATMLRRPASYSLEVGASFEKAPGPGALRVISDGETAGGAVALILDASGSMLKRLEGKRRIDIAKDLLSTAVGEHIPQGTPVALRVFGHKEPNTCRTDLVLPMKPLDPAAVQKTLANITAMNLAKTPIADSLAQVESDLKGATGTRVVVLVTDGEETCEGDPQAVLETLAERGIDLRLEIVGFAIADDELKAQFEGWAEQGGGRYFDAGDTESLERSLADALRVPYIVYDEDGSEVARGTVDGDPLELEAGIYRVSIASSPPKSLEAVEIPGESTIEVSVPR